MFALLNFLLPGSDEGYKVADGKFEGVTNNHKPRPAIKPCHGQSCSFLDGLFVPKPTAFENELNASWRGPDSRPANHVFGMSSPIAVPTREY
jgi:hypothetical protein